MKEEQVEEFEAVQAQITSLYDEILILAKKSPNDGVNVFKLGIINSLINRANTVIENLNAHKPLENFTLFDFDNLPSNSDVVLIVSQYIACLEKIRSDNIEYELGEWFWRIEKGKKKIQTTPPKKLIQK